MMTGMIGTVIGAQAGVCATANSIVITMITIVTIILSQIAEQTCMIATVHIADLSHLCNQGRGAGICVGTPEGLSPGTPTPDLRSGKME